MNIHKGFFLLFSLHASCTFGKPSIWIPVCADSKVLYSEKNFPNKRFALFEVSGDDSCVKNWATVCYPVLELATPYWKKDFYTQKGWPNTKPTGSLRGWENGTKSTYVDVHLYGDRAYVFLFTDTDAPACPGGAYSEKMKRIDD